MAEYDLICGLSGLGAYHLHRHPQHEITAEVLSYLVRLTDCIAELTQATRPIAAKEIATALVQLALQTGDAHTASLLTHIDGWPHLAADQRALTHVIEASGTRARAMPPQHLLNSLTTATRHALTTLADLLTSAREPDQSNSPTTT
ncbi:hypothetical protein [Saccharothrix sp. Mg75]|uniref:hypothetical protein n=1 Tax=Saccharothrix sp. Mg75 TaxID=3445357 RepID=UPI003EE9FC91